MTRMTKIIAALALTIPATAMAQDDGAVPAEPMSFEMFQETYGNALDPSTDDRIEFEILDTDNDGFLSPEEQTEIDETGAPGGDGGITVDE